ncbi:MAG: sugar ABC transporter ATP-binding protein, partial [Actinobacteria bacterium]|nr:sugar ABC transporter ATP-binding protein [Actinomycetota bacterium]
MLEARSIVKRYGVVTALAGVDLTIGPGEIVALAGENGSGKSTLAKVVAGAIDADEGGLELDGAPCAFTRPRDAIDAGIVLVAQEPTAAPRLSIAENVMLMRLPSAGRRFDRRAVVRAARPYLEEVGVDRDPSAPLETLGPGDRALVEVARALAASPRLLILDEATSRLGEADVERVFAVVRRLRDTGTSTILITHRLREICDLADRAVVLRDGRVVGGLGRAELDEHPLATMMVGRELSELYGKRSIVVGRPLLRLEEVVAEGAVEPVTLDVHEGEVVAIAGLVGSGRTELLETVAGVRRARGGAVSVSGRPVRAGSPRDAIEAGIALVPEDRHRQGLVLDASVRTNVAMGQWRSLSGPGRRRETAAAAEAVERLRIKTAGLDAPV